MMSGTVAVDIERPISSVQISGGGSEDGTGALSDGGRHRTAAEQEQKGEGTEISSLFGALKSAIDKLNQFYDKMFVEQREEIVKLSVEIARKILMQKVKEGDYEIEKIVQEAFKNAPTHQEVVVRLNPDDLVQCQKAQQGEGAGVLAGIKFVADPNIGRAECVLESPKGTVESLIEANLEKISGALAKAE
jgi:flagellar biosynthesis/type III secretory pathway protein FliH